MNTHVDTATLAEQSERLTPTMRASMNWARRPADERFTSLTAMRDYKAVLRQNTSNKLIDPSSLTFAPLGDGRGAYQRTLQVSGHNGVPALLTNWSFGQMAGEVSAPTGFLRRLPSALAAANLNVLFKTRGERKSEDGSQMGAYLSRNVNPDTLAVSDDIFFRSLNGPRYGRVFDLDILNWLIETFGDGITGTWIVPGEFGQKIDVTKANTTLFCSDRDMFVFLADEVNRVEMPNRRNGQSGSLAKGFFISNSEVGSRSLRVTFFLYDYACCNRIVWGMSDIDEVVIRHSSGAPERWLNQVQPVLETYRNGAASTIEARLVAAQNKKVDDIDAFLKTLDLTGIVADAAKAAHLTEEGRPMESLWDVATGLTAFAKSVDFQDERVAIETVAGKVLNFAD